MKVIDIILIIALVLVCSTVWAWEIKANGKPQITMKWVEPDKANPDGYLEITTRNGAIFRIYPCGEVRKQEWKKLNENEDNNTITVPRYWYNGGNTTLTPSDTTLLYNSGTGALGK